jgi:mannitol-1-phosphate 5-dehydrogenase
MKRAIQFGAGNIGRGFIGAVLSQAGYHVVFADVNMEIIDRINHDGNYTVHIMDVESRDLHISDISGVNSGSDDIVAEIVKAELITTAVGLRILPYIAPAIAKGIAARRAASVEAPLNIVACENGIRATSQLKEEVYKHLSADDAAWSATHVGFADCSVDRIVPPVRSENPIDVVVENFYEWNVEEKSFVGGAPHIEGMNLADNLLAYIERKLFTLNTGHAITAYLGRMKGLKTIDESIADATIFAIVKEAMQQSGMALVKKFGFDKEAHFKYIDKIIGRFKNPYLKDDVTRVGREPQRKLSSSDRLIKPMLTAREYGLPCDKLLLGIGAALHYNNPEDPQSVKMQELIAAKGLRQAVAEIASIASTDPVIDEIATATADVERVVR